ncbi:hypothetical protein AGLY_002794, partial [Aphis glycines]
GYKVTQPVHYLCLTSTRLKAVGYRFKCINCNLLNINDINLVNLIKLINGPTIKTTLCSVIFLFWPKTKATILVENGHAHVSSSTLYSTTITDEKFVINVVKEKKRLDWYRVKANISSQIFLLYMNPSPNYNYSKITTYILLKLIYFLSILIQSTLHHALILVCEKDLLLKTNVYNETTVLCSSSKPNTVRCTLIILAYLNILISIVQQHLSVKHVIKLIPSLNGSNESTSSSSASPPSVII